MVSGTMMPDSERMHIAVRCCWPVPHTPTAGGAFVFRLTHSPHAEYDHVSGSQAWVLHGAVVFTWGAEAAGRRNNSVNSRVHSVTTTLRQATCHFAFGEMRD